MHFGIYDMRISLLLIIQVVGLGKSGSDIKPNHILSPNML